MKPLALWLALALAGCGSRSLDDEAAPVRWDPEPDTCQPPTCYADPRPPKPLPGILEPKD